MPVNQRTNPTLGVLSGWPLYQETIDSFLLSLYRGMRAAAQVKQCNLLIAGGLSPTLGFQQTAGPLLDAQCAFVPVGPWNTDGLIIVSPITYPPLLSYISDLETQGYPLVWVGEEQRHPNVLIDNTTGIRQAIAHLAAHGHRRIAFIAGKKDDPGDSLTRLQAYHTACAEFGLDTDPRLIAYGEHWHTPSRQAVLDLLAAKVEFTALLASNDVSAYGVLQALREAGRRVPQDMAVIGFDDRPESAGQTPPLSTVRYPTFEAGYQAVELLLHRLLEPLSTAKATVMIPSHLVLRESCGCQLNDCLVAAQPGAWPTQLAAQHDWLALTMTEILVSHARYLTPPTHCTLSTDLLTAFTTSLSSRQTEQFQTSLHQVLSQLESADENPHILQLALLALAQAMSGLVTESMNIEWGHQLLHDAQVLVSQQSQQQHIRYMTQQWRSMTQMGFLNARLLTALTEQQILEQLARQLPTVGFSSAVVAFFQSDAGDPVTWSLAYKLENGKVIQRPGWRIRSREFPPADLYPSGPYQLVLLPLLGEDNIYYGFGAFDVNSLESCIPIAIELTAVFKSIRLYQATAESQRLAEEARQVAETANQLKSRFLASVSHELRTPLNLVVGLSEMALQGQPAGDTLTIQRADLEQIHSSAQHLSWLIRDVLDLASNQAGQLRLTYEDLDFSEVLEVVAAAGEQLTHAKGLQWTAQFPAQLPHVWGDCTRLRQVGLNLISNAVKFTERGSVTLTVTLEAASLQLAVTDTGLGVAAEEQSVIFDEFRQSERTTQRGFGGVGLGLAISKRLVELHGGEIGVTSAGVDGGGSTFYFRLPILARSPLAALTGASVETGRVLLLVTQLTQGAQLSDILQQAGLVVDLRAVTPTEDWLADVPAAHPAAVVLEAPLAAQHGLELLHLLKNQPATQYIPVLFYAFTPNAESGAIVTLDYLSKPLQPQALNATLAQHNLANPEQPPRAILVVEDDPGTLSMHSRLVQTQLPHSRVLQAHNGQEALTIIERDLPDLVLLDLMMPEMDGFAVLEAMRANVATRNIPVIVLTARILMEEDMARLNQGVATVLSKGVFTPIEMFQYIKQALLPQAHLKDGMRRAVRSAMAYIHAHYGEPITREALAQYINFSPAYLNRSFQRELGLSPMEYLIRYRLQQAKTLLAHTARSIADIGLEVGFASHSHFTQVFQREVGMSPRSYRRQQQTAIDEKNSPPRPPVY